MKRFTKRPKSRITANYRSQTPKERGLGDTDMKHHIAGSTKIPEDMQKYYRYATLNTLARELIELSEAEDYISMMKELCEDAGVEYVGLAIANDEYEDELTELGDDIVTIIKDGENMKLTVYRNGKFEDVSKEVKRCVKASSTIYSNYVKASTGKLPSNLSKYYKFATAKTLADEGFMSLKEAKDFFKEQSELCENDGCKLLGFAIANDEYYDDISDIGYEVVNVVDWNGDIRLLIDIGNSLYDVEDEVLETVEGSCNINASQSIVASKIIPNKRIQEGLSWDYNGHDFTVTKMLSSWECEVTETWIGEDSGRELSNTEVWQISSAPGDGQYIYLDDSSLTFYATGADNYPWDEYFASNEHSDEYDKDDDYIPHASSGDYGPGCPWNAPGLSESDFI